MDHNQVHHQPENRQVICTATYNQAQQRILRASSANFSRAFEPGEMQYYNERPMMLDTWTQTSNTDLGVSDDYLLNVYMDQQRQREKALLEKISLLKAELRAHSEMLSQMQSSNINRSSLTIQKQQNRQQQQSVVVANAMVMQQQDQQSKQQRQPHEQSTSPQMQLYHTQPSSINAQECEEVILPHKPHEQLEQRKLVHNNTNSQYIATKLSSSVSSTTQQNDIVSQNPHTIINNTQDVRPRNVNYTIIADGHPDGEDGPIEIEIAEEDNALNLNCSADSERLEICLAEEQALESNVNYVKYEVENEQNYTQEKSHFERKNRASCSVSPGGSKRLKTSSENPTSYSKQKIFDVREVSQEESEYSEPPNFEMAESRPLLPLQMNRNNASLLKLPVEPHQRDSEQSTPSTGKQEPKVFYCSIGPNNTRISTKVFDAISWASASIATRKLMMAVFNRETLATHSMTGKPSPAFKDHNKPLKKMLNPLAIQDIIFAVTRRCKVSEKEVRNAITTKCADENKMWKLALAKNRSVCEQDKENIA